MEVSSPSEYNEDVAEQLLPVNADPRELMRDPVVLQAMQLADRLREAKGDALDADEYEAIAEATGVAPEYLRFLEQDKSVRKARNFADNLRAQYFALENDTRRYVSAGVLGTFTALCWRLGEKLDALTSNPALGSKYGVFQTFCYILAASAIYNSSVAKTQKAGAGSGLVFGATSYLMSTVFGLLFFIGNMQNSPPFILLWGTLWALIGLAAHAVTHQKGKGTSQATKGVEARQELLKQLVDLQDQLRQGSQNITFLSLDVVGSTKMKIGADTLAVEFTFNEYHKYVERVVEKYSGRVHSTAGDGVTIAFDHAQSAFNAAKQIQTGMVEFNALRNKLGVPLALRAGIHTGDVVAPKSGDVTSINFASVIDIAAHLQKESPVGGVAVSDTAVGSIAGGSQVVGTDRVCVHDTWATIWMRKRALDSFRLNETATSPSQA